MKTTQRKPWMLMVVAAMLVILIPLQSAWAFSDTSNDPNGAKIESLQQRGIISGSGGDLYSPKGQVSYAQAVTLLVKGLDLNLNNISFVKQPSVTDYFPSLSNKAWYAEAFIIAQLNELPIPKNVNSAATITREQFADLLFKAISTKGDWAYAEMFVMIKDEKQINSSYMNSIQRLLVSNIVQLNGDNTFEPKKALTRSDAAGWVYDAIDFVNKMRGQQTDATNPTSQPVSTVSGATVSITKVNDEVNKVTITAKAPNPGYRLRITSITFNDDTATINIEPVLPNPALMYPAVIANVTAVTYLDATYKVVLSGQGFTGTNQGS